MNFFSYTFTVFDIMGIIAAFIMLGIAIFYHPVKKH